MSFNGTHITLSNLLGVHFEAAVGSHFSVPMFRLIVFIECVFPLGLKCKLGHSLSVFIFHVTSHQLVDVVWELYIAVAFIQPRAFVFIVWVYC